MPPQIHPSSNIIGDVKLADDVVVGPCCTLTGPITIGAGTSLTGHNYLTGPLTIGTYNRIYPFVCLGLEPQDYKFDPSAPCAGLAIGNNNLFREQVTIHRATSAEKPTMVGNDNFFMLGSDIGHDCTIGSKCIIVSKVSMGGHAILEDQVTLGGSANIAQHTRVGRLAFVGGLSGYSLNIPPYMITRTRNSVYSVNVIGMRRAGYTADEINHARWAFKIIFRQHLARPAILKELTERTPISPVVQEIHTFLARPKTPICHYHGHTQPAKLTNT